MTMIRVDIHERGAAAWFVALLLVAAACGTSTLDGATPRPPRLGSLDRPLVIALAPSGDTQRALATGEQVATALSKTTGLKFRAHLPTSYATAIEGLCSERLDAAYLSPLAYIVAKDRGCATYLTTSVRQGSPTYRGQIRVHASSGISDLSQLRGKKFAFTDTVSTAGSMYPQLLIRRRFNVTAKEFFSDYVFAGGPDQAMFALYNQQVDGAATFIDPNTDVPAGALRYFPDLAQKTKRLAETEDIPWDPLVVRKDLPKDLADQIRTALLDYARTADGRRAVGELFSSEGFVEIPEWRYEDMREGAKIVGIDLESEIRITPRPFAPPAASPSRSP